MKGHRRKNRFTLFSLVVIFGASLELLISFTTTSTSSLSSATFSVDHVVEHVIKIERIHPRVVQQGSNWPPQHQRHRHWIETYQQYSPSQPMDAHIWPFERPYYEECTPMAEWQTKHYPNCNLLHEIDVTDGTVQLLSTKGSWRTVWLSQPHANTTKHSVVLKFLRLDREFNHESFQYHQIDAMAMERLSASTHVVNAYGYCGQSVITEYASGSARDHVKDSQFSSLQRLTMGRDLCRAFSDLHSIDYPNCTNATFAHNDINLANAVEINGRIRLNDFNIGILMKWNKTQACNSPVRFQNPLWKAPEEIANHSYIDPAMADIYGLGNLLFQVMTKHQPWTHLEPDGPLEKHIVAMMKINGTLPHVPDKHRLSNKTAIQALYYATMACFRPNPRDRLTSCELAEALDLVLRAMKVASAKHYTIPREIIQQLFER